MAKIKTIAEIRYDNFMILLKEAGGYNVDLATKTGINAAQISQIRSKVKYASGNVKGIGNNLARKFERGMRKRKGWMDVSHSKGVGVTKKTNVTKYKYSEAVLIAWDKLRAGNIKDARRLSAGEVKTLVFKKDAGRKLVELVVEDDSMFSPQSLRSYPVGCSIVVDPDKKPAHGCRIVVRQKKGAYPLFRQLSIVGDERTLIPLNQRYEHEPMKPRAEILGVVIQMVIHED